MITFKPDLSRNGYTGTIIYYGQKGDKGQCEE